MPQSTGQHPKKPISFLQISTSAAGGAAQADDALTLGHGRWGLQLVQAGHAGGNQVCSSPAAAETLCCFLPTVAAFAGLTIGCCSGVSWTWQEHSYSSKASGGKCCYYSSVKDFQLE